MPAPVRTYQDLLTSAARRGAVRVLRHQPARRWSTPSTGARTPVGRPAIFQTFAPSPDGTFVLVARVKRPFSWLVPYDDFPTLVEVWDRKGASVKTNCRPAARRHRAQRRRASWPALVALAAHAAGDRGVGRGARRRRPEGQRAASRQADDAGRPVLRRAGGSSRDSEWRAAPPVWTEAGVLMLTENDRKTRMTTHLAARSGRGRPPKAVGAEPGGLLRQSGHAAEARAWLRRRGRPAGWRRDLPGGRRLHPGRRPPVPRSSSI